MLYDNTRESAYLGAFLFGVECVKTDYDIRRGMIMKFYECAVCGQTVDRSLVCRKCRRDYDLSSTWAVDLIASEKQWRNMQRRDDRNGLVVFSDYTVQQEGEIFDGWDVLDGEIAGPSGDAFLNAMGSSDSYFEKKEWLDWNEKWTEKTLYDVAEVADLTLGEINALVVYLFPPNSLPVDSNTAAGLLSTIEGKAVSTDAYPRRKSDALKKLKQLGDRLEQIAPQERNQNGESDVFSREDLFRLQMLIHQYGSQL